VGTKRLGYNGADHNLRYAFGQALFALDDPTQLIHRCTYPLLEPTTEHELNGQVPQVVFAKGWFLSKGSGLFNMESRIHALACFSESKLNARRRCHTNFSVELLDAANCLVSGN
jgi:hypothetical protein